MTWRSGMFTKANQKMVIMLANKAKAIRDGKYGLCLAMNLVYNFFAKI